MLIREASEDDAAALAAIYNWYIANSLCTFEIEPVSPDQIKERLARRSELHPWLVLENETRLIGYAYACAWKSRAAYARSAETSVYLDKDSGGKGYGLLLMQHLIELLRQQPVHTLIAGITLPNAASVALHEKLGFRAIGSFSEVGFKFGCYADVGYWQLQLGAGTNTVRD